jgi:hypothetical protein
MATEQGKYLFEHKNWVKNGSQTSGPGNSDVVLTAISTGFLVTN